MRPFARLAAVEWPTLGLLVGVYGAFLLLALHAESLGWGAPFLFGVLIALHSSLQHEALHGHPFRAPRINALLVALPLGLFVPYWRFRALHIAHHDDPRLTDPYEDPESWYQHPRDWASAGPGRRLVLRLNNTLAGRVLLGPAVSLAAFYRTEARLIRAGQRGVARAWIEHAAFGALLFWLLAQVPGFPFTAYLAGCYLGFSLLAIRTFLEHQAEEAVGHRTVLIEDRGPLAFLFLFNSLHAVHHARPGLPWYRLPAVYAENREAFIRDNGGYVFRSYWQVIRTYAFRAKEPVPHPLKRSGPPAGA